MAYQANKPEATDQKNISQGDIQGNFAAIKTLVDINHVTFDEVAQGKHKHVTFPEQAADPATLGNEVALYCKETSVGGAAHSALFFKPEGQIAGGTEYDFTTAKLEAAGWCKLPCGLIMKWGHSDLITTGATGTAALVTADSIPNIATLFSCQLTIYGGVSGTEGNMFVQTFDDVTSHTITIRYWKPFTGTLTRACYYFAIGI